MAVKQLIEMAFSEAFNKYIYNEMVIGKLANTELKTNIKKNDEIDVRMPAMVTVSKYDGGELDDPEKVTTSHAKIQINKGSAVHFGISQIDEDFIATRTNKEDQAKLVREYTSDAIKQIAANVDTAYGALYTRAGKKLEDDGKAITLDTSNVKAIMAFMEAKFKRGDGKGHTNWIDGQMICIVPPEFEFYLTQLQDYEQVESGHRKIEKGFVGNLAGWEIYESNNIANPTGDEFYPLFGIKGKTLAGGISKDLNMMHYVPDKSFDTNYKGYALYGVGAPRADFLGTARVKATLSL